MAAFELVVAIGQRGEKHEGIFEKRGASAISRSSSSKPDISGMLMSDSTRSGMILRIAASPSRPSWATSDRIAAVDQFLGDQRRGLAVVLDAKNLLWVCFGS